jgi:cbb3-type cytochrome oxidase subunit 3
MTRAPSFFSEDVLLAFAASVALAAVVIAFVAYVITWFSARRQQRRAAATLPAPDLRKRDGDRHAGEPGPAARNGVGAARR